MTTYHPDTTQTYIPQNDSSGSTGLLRKARNTARDTQAREVADEAHRQINDTATQASLRGKRFVQENPTLAMLGAIGFGIFLGVALRAR
ncbi:hypothetical protein [uncultured Marivita sp.]|uniref:hypothetical protein n=1 Tax=uncultured Marivita sp. TaxID=888080 RepID=UPI00263110EC|nr:hypothetical protein [uncultured Marivita sp.]